MSGRFLYVLGLTVMLASLPASREVIASPGDLHKMLPSYVTRCTDPETDPHFQRHSLYIPASRGAKLAADIFLPESTPPMGKHPTLFVATRYWRGARGADLDQSLLKEWIGRGFAVVIADVRGTGASTGQWYIPYSPQEVRDIGLLARWISEQAWSNGKVVMTGNSYTGTTSLLGPAHAPGIVVATAPKFSDFDLYTDLLFPGGIATDALSREWGKLVHDLDLNQTDPGVRPVDGPEGQSLLAVAVKDHNALGFSTVPDLVTFADGPVREYRGLTMQDGGAYRHRGQLERSHVPIFGWGSWLDSGIAQGLLNRFLTFSNPQLTIIGAWTHGVKASADVFDLDAELDPTSDELDHLNACFLNHFALVPDGKAGDAAASERTIVYFTMGEGRWKTTHAWPIPGTYMRRFFLDKGGALSNNRPSSAAEDTYQVDFDASTGPANRWATQAGAPRIDYGNRAEADTRLLVYTGEALREEMEITGQPVVTLRITSTHADGNFIVYLEDVAPDGRVTYLTEGELRAIHRKLSAGPAPYRSTYPYRSFLRKDAQALVPHQPATLIFQLQATSVMLRPGHHIRLSLAGADSGTLLRHPASREGAVTLKVSRGSEDGSFIELPVVPRASAPTAQAPANTHNIQTRTRTDPW